MAETGWICPMCEHGVHPDQKRCECRDIKVDVSTTPSVSMTICPICGQHYAMGMNHTCQNRYVTGGLLGGTVAPVIQMDRKYQVQEPLPFSNPDW